jgi:hypothetical protein
VLSYLDSAEQHRSKLHSVNPLERLNKGGQTPRRYRRIFPTRPQSFGGSALLQNIRRPLPPIVPYQYDIFGGRSID